jgi:hypothetical protein
MKTPSKDRRPIARRIRDAWPDLEPLVEAGYPLKDIWEEWDQFDVSYRHFIRTILKIQRQPRNSTARAPTVAGKGSATESAGQGKLPPAKPGKFDPLINLREHEARKPTFEYQGTRSEEELV